MTEGAAQSPFQQFHICQVLLDIRLVKNFLTDPVIDRIEGTIRGLRSFIAKIVAGGPMNTILLIILIILLIGALPTWPHSAGWGYYPSGGLGLVLIILLILAVMGRI